jgi:hypothetical protein
MNNLEIKVNKQTRYVTLSKTVLGVDGENLQENLVFYFEDEFVDGTARLEYLVENEKKYITLTKEDSSYSIPVKNVMLKTGNVIMQLVITEGTNEDEIPVFKSKKFYLWVEESINAVDEAPDSYTLWIDTANEKLNEVDNLDIDVSKEGNVSTLEITKKDGTKKSVEILDGQGGGDGTSDYNQLTNKPKINGIELEDDKTLEELGYTPYDDSEVQREISNINSALKNKANKSEIPDVSNFITKSVNDLENYLKSSETYTKDQVNELIGNVSTIKIDVVDDLPETGETNIIYFVSNDESTENNIYDEYVYINGKPELIGNTNIDLSPYALKTEFNNYYTKDEVENTIADGIEKNIGKEVQLDFNAILEDNKIIATLDESISDYELQNSTGYLFHIYLPLVTLTGDLDNTYPIYLKDKDGNDININSMFQKDINETSTVGDLCQIQDYDTGVGYSWEFYGHFRKISDNGNTINVVYTDSVVRETNPSMTGEQLHLSVSDNKLKVGTSVICISDYENNGTSYVKGHTYLIENDSDTEDIILIATDITSKTDLTNYVKFTDYASNSKTGVVKVVNGTGIRTTSDGSLQGAELGYSTYNSVSDCIIGKKTLENVFNGKGFYNKADKVSVTEATETTIEIEPNKFYKFGEVEELNITLATPSDTTILNEYMFEFISGETATTLTLPDTIKWLEEPTIEANMTYQCSIVDNVGVLLGVSNE